MKKTNVYRSTVPGDETTPLIPVEVLPPIELALFKRIEKLKQLIDEADAAKDEIRRLRSKCSHHYFYDTAGFPYDTRTCAACGAHMGLL